MLSFPIDVRQRSPEGWFAYWVDFPDYGPISGHTPEAAFNALVDQTFNTIADLVNEGRAPQPSPANGRPTVTFSPVNKIIPPHIGRLIGVTRYGTLMTTYSWTNDFAYIG